MADRDAPRLAAYLSDIERVHLARRKRVWCVAVRQRLAYLDVGVMSCGDKAIRGAKS